MWPNDGQAGVVSPLDVLGRRMMRPAWERRAERKMMPRLWRVRAQNRWRRRGEMDAFECGQTTARKVLIPAMKPRLQ